MPHQEEERTIRRRRRGQAKAGGSAAQRLCSKHIIRPWSRRFHQFHASRAPTLPRQGRHAQQRKVVAGPKKWADALAYCKEGLTLSGKSDWRLPQVRELHGIVDYKESGPAIDKDAFPSTPASFFWSAAHPDIYNSLYVYFGYGSVGVIDVGKSYEVRCVRAD